MRNIKLLLSFLAILSFGQMHAQCVAALNVTPTSNAGEFTFTDNSNFGDYSYLDPGFGSGVNLLPSPSVTITYPANGTYNYSYLIFDSLPGGCSDTIFGTVIVTGVSPCNVTAGLTITQGSIPGQYTFTDNSTNATQGYLDVYSAIGTSNYQLLPSNPATHTFPANGTYYYYYAVFNGAGCGDTIIDSIIVTGINNPCPSFAGVTITQTSTPGQITITDNSTGGQYSYFEHGAGGPSVSVLPNPSATYTYPANGTYSYAYIVADSSTGCMDTVYGSTTITGITNPTPCMASFILLQDSTNASQYYCWNTATSSAGTTIGMTYLWDFGDGTTSTMAYPTHTYNSLGLFTICLTISDATGCTSTYCDTISITVKASGTTVNVLPAGANLGIEKSETFQSINLYPNPSSSVTNLSIGSSIDSEISIHVMSLSGQILYSEFKNIKIGENQIDLNIYDLASGVYIVSVLDANSGSEKSLRLIKN